MNCQLRLFDREQFSNPRPRALNDEELRVAVLELEFRRRELCDADAAFMSAIDDDRASIAECDERFRWVEYRCQRWQDLNAEILNTLFFRFGHAAAAEIEQFLTDEAKQ